MPKKLKGGGDPLGFFNIHSVAKHQKNAGATLWGKNSEKNVSQCRKKIERGDCWVSPSMVCYAEKQAKSFWSSSLGHMVQFDTIIFCRTFKNFFGQFVWIEKKSHYSSRVSLHEAPTKKPLFRHESAHFWHFGSAENSSSCFSRYFPDFRLLLFGFLSGD